MKTKILFHSFGNGRHCPDGFAAAYALWKLFKDQAQYIPCVYQEPPPDIEPGDEVYLVDFSYPREVLLAWDAIANVTVLDHHKTAQADLEGLPFAQFDMNRSGAQLAWDLWRNTRVQPWTYPEPKLISYVADRDLWRKELPHTEAVHLALSTFPQDFKVWDALADIQDYVEVMRLIGEPLLLRRNIEIENLVLDAQWREFAGYRVLSINTDRYSLVSDALNVLCKWNPKTPFAFNFFETDGVTKYELRSVGEFDVSAIAKQFGGGGHKNAAGCSIAHSETKHD